MNYDTRHHPKLKRRSFITRYWDAVPALFYSVFLHSLLHSRKVKNTNIEWDFTPYRTLHIVLGGLHDDHANDDKITETMGTRSDLALGGI